MIFREEAMKADLKDRKALRIQRRWIESTEDFFHLKSEWKRLLSRIPGHTIFLTWEWMYTWWEAYHRRFKEARLRILTYYLANELVGILPYYIYTDTAGPFSLRKAAFLGSRIESSDYLDVIVPEALQSYFQQHLLEDIRTLAEGVDLIEINNCLADSLVFRVWGQQQNGTAFVERYRVCPYVHLPESFEAYLKGLSSNFRYNVRRRLRKLLQKENARVELLEDWRRLDEAIKDIFDLHYLRARQKGLNTKFVRELRLGFHQKAARALAPEGYIKIFNMFSAEGHKIAGMYCFDYDNVLAYFQAGFDPRWSNRSPGTVILAEAIHYAIRQGKGIFDFMRGGEQYKKDWGTSDRYIYLITIPNSWKGRLFLSYYRSRKRLAPVVKKIIHSTQ